MSSDTIYALSSGPLPAAIAIVRISGPLAEEAASRLAGALPPPRQASLRKLRDSDGSVIDEALLLRFAGNRTATGEPLVEFHLHGSRAVVARLFAELSTMPRLREAEPGEFTRRALLNGRIGLTEAEGLGELLSAETEWQRRAALATFGGALRRQVEGWRERLVALSAQAEAAIDYVGDEDETAVDLLKLERDAQQLRAEWERWLAQPPAELLEHGLRVVLAGPPNSGKSSLFNALLGSEKAIVTPVAGTTRDLLEAGLDMDGVPLILVDTAGQHESGDEVERIGIVRARQAQADADLLLWLGTPEDAPVRDGVILIHSRADERGPAPSGSIAASVFEADGLALLREAISREARRLLPPPDHVALNRRQKAALSIASQALAQVGGDLLLMAEDIRHALAALDRLTGHSSTEDVLDALFGRFCLGK
nr:tRNA uridine-5-carboxymethylaminomethyl(34) synthesis GTPase MnmE [uncultured Sphingomonas sp.]